MNDYHRHTTPFAALLAASIEQAKRDRHMPPSKIDVMMPSTHVLDFELFVMRDLSRGDSDCWFVEIWGRGDQTEPAYRSDYHETIEGARDDGDRWLRAAVEKLSRRRP